MGNKKRITNPFDADSFTPEALACLEAFMELQDAWLDEDSTAGSSFSQSEVDGKIAYLDQDFKM